MRHTRLGTGDAAKVKTFLQEQHPRLQRERRSRREIAAELSGLLGCVVTPHHVGYYLRSCNLPTPRPDGYLRRPA